MNDAHGGDVYAAARETGRPLHRLTDFSASINPLGPSPRVCRAVSAACRRPPHYPDPTCTALREALAKHHGIDPECLLIGNGSIELIYLVPLALRLRRVLVIGPTFTEYARAISLHGGLVISINATRDTEYRPPIEEAIRRIKTGRPSPDAMVLCNPNSPTGQSVDVETASALVEAIGRRRGWAIVDETFVEYCEQHSLMPRLGRFPHLLILRSFTKFYALAAFRIGYLAGSEEAIGRLRAAQPPWSVNMPAQAAGLASLSDSRYTARTLRSTAVERAALVAALRSIPGVFVYSSDANFLLVELPHPYTATRVTQSLGRDGLLIRDCSSIKGLTARTIRAAVRTRPENRRLVAALRRALTAGDP